MNKGFLRLTGLLLVLALLSGCGGFGTDQRIQSGTAAYQEESVSQGETLHFRDMAYVRPELEEMEQALADTLDTAQAGDIRATMDEVYRLYDLFDWFYTCCSLADVRYSGDLTDDYWRQEYEYCSENSVRVDAMLEELYYGLAASPIREKLELPQFFGEGFFDAYTGENPLDEAVSTLLDREAQLENRYYTLSEQTLDYEYASTELYDACADDLAQLLVEMIRVRQELALEMGYGSYPELAWDFYYDRDYTLADAQAYLADIRAELVELYAASADSACWDGLYTYCSEADTMAYLEQTADGMGGSFLHSYRKMMDRGLYDTDYSENKYNASYEVYLTSYGVPYLFMKPELSNYDCLTLVHEFGHFCNDDASGGSYADVDVGEVFSQAMEYLALVYGPEVPGLQAGKMADSLALYVEQGAYMDFELRMYELTGEDLSVQGLYDLYAQVAKEYGFGSMGYDPREFVQTVHFYTNPMYIMSYLVSNDAALQLYQMELENPGAGRDRLEANLDTPFASLLAFLESAELDSPFVPCRIREVRQLLEAELA